MSTEKTTTNTRDIYTIYQQNVDKFLDTVRQAVPRYHQAITNTQQEYVKACENIISANVSIQREFAIKAGMTASVPDAANKIIQDVTEEAIKVVSVQNKVALTAIDAAQQNIKTFNDNAKAFADLNKSITQSWISTFTAGKTR